MGTAKKTRKFGLVSRVDLEFLDLTFSYYQVKRIIGQNDARLKKNQAKGEEGAKKADKGSEVVREVYAAFCLPIH
jgi:U3 small nucleolar RNA-associated protein 24